mmetsp:Transcript_26088/g.34248  ORF Transcript_26088/g.34248 Transcript_26088/m.34248 type:complete len:729 (-) Transcript_26088:347-2533(-)
MFGKAAILLVLIFHILSAEFSRSVGWGEEEAEGQQVLYRKRLASPLTRLGSESSEASPTTTAVYTSRIALVPTTAAEDQVISILHQGKLLDVPIDGLRENSAAIAFFPVETGGQEVELQITCALGNEQPAGVVGSERILPLKARNSMINGDAKASVFTIPESCDIPQSLHFESGSAMDAGMLVLAFSESTPSLNLNLVSRDLIAGTHQDIVFNVWFDDLDWLETSLVSFEAELTFESEVKTTASAKVINKPYGTKTWLSEEGKTQLKLPIQGKGLHKITINAIAEMNVGNVLRTLQTTVPVLGQECLPRISKESPILMPPSPDTPEFWDILIKFEQPVDDGSECSKDYEDVQISAELWTSSDKPLAQLSTISPRAMLEDRHLLFLQTKGLSVDGPFYMLSFHQEWLKASEDQSYPWVELKNLQLKDRHTHILIDKLEGPVRFANQPAWIQAILEATRRSLRGPTPSLQTSENLSKAMLHGPVPKDIISSLDDEETDEEAPILLSHGYCASRAPFPRADFPDNSSFHYTGGYNEAISNDDLAREILAFMAGKNAQKYTMVGHSQGGMAALHIYTYYWSGLDQIAQEVGEDVYLIQALSSPFQGTPLMDYWFLTNFLAELGFLCGYITDLSKDGALAWLEGIPLDRRRGVMYYTIWNGEGYVPCVLAAEIFFSSYDDGATEVQYNSLEGSAGPAVENPKASWCHSTGMNHDPGYYDHSRNQVMKRCAAKY